MTNKRCTIRIIIIENVYQPCPDNKIQFVSNKGFAWLYCYDGLSFNSGLFDGTGLPTIAPPSAI